MRKAQWGRALAGVFLATVVGSWTLLCSAPACADTGRSDVVNPGNAKHLSNPAPPADKPKPHRTPKPGVDETPQTDKSAPTGKTSKTTSSAKPSPAQSATAPVSAPATDSGTLALLPPAASTTTPTTQALSSLTPQAAAAEVAEIALQLGASQATTAGASAGAQSTPQPAAQAASAPTVPAATAPAAAPATAVQTPVPDTDATCPCKCVSGSCGTVEFNGPLAVVSQHPPSILFYAPLPDVASVLAPGAKTVTTSLQLTNNFIHTIDSGTVVDLDFEVLRLTLDYRQRLGRGDLGVRLPLDYRSQGFLDPLIENYHSMFGFNPGQRINYPENQFHYSVITRDGVAYNGVGPVVGLGDLALSYKYPLWDHGAGHNAAALRVGVKAPTGSSSDALGSGNWDYSAGALWQQQFSAHLRGYVNVDYVATGAVDWPNIQQHNILHTMWGAEYALSPRFSLVTQYETATNGLITGSVSSDKDPRELTVGFNHRTGPHVVWSGGFREDISPNSAPDFGVLSNFKWEF